MNYSNDNQRKVWIVRFEDPMFDVPWSMKVVGPKTEAEARERFERFYPTCTITEVEEDDDD